VLGAADTQTIFVGAFLLGFAGQSKCELTSYHFTVAVNQMMIALAVITFSVALVRTYWRNPLAAGLRLLLSIGAFTGVGLMIFRKANYAPDWPPPSKRKDSAILLPVACLLETELRTQAQQQAEKAEAKLGFGKSHAWPWERYFFIALIVAFVVAHASIPIRFAENRNRDGHHGPWRLRWTKFRGWVTVAYWASMLVPPTIISVYCWTRVYQVRDWVKNSGWIQLPNTEYVIWDSGQLIAIGVLITVLSNVLTEGWKREGKDSKRLKDGSFERLTESDTSAYEERRSNSYLMAQMGHDTRTKDHGYEEASSRRR